MNDSKGNGAIAPQSGRTRLGDSFAAAMAIAAGALVLLVPALIYGRPFIYFDTWEFYGWGHDVLAAIRDPWPSSGAFPTGRELWIKYWVPSGTPITVDETEFRLLLTQVGARSAYYAVPLYALHSLWLAAIVQALLVSWTLWTAARAFALRPLHLAFFAIVAALTVATTLPFVVAFMMPDVFGGIIALASGLILFFPERLSRSQRWGLLALILYGIVAHTSNIALAFAAVLLGALVMGARHPWRAALGRIGPLGGVFGAGLLLLVLGSAGLGTIFGRPVQNPPFLLGRVIADGPGIAFLKAHCDKTDFVACELEEPGRFGVSRYRGDDLLFSETHWGPQPFSARTDLQRRGRFYAEAPEIILGTIAYDPVGVLGASLRNGMQQVATFGLRDMFEPLPRMLSSGQAVRERIASITPDVAECRVNPGRSCGWPRVWRILSLWHQGFVAVAGLMLVFRLASTLAGRSASSAFSPEHAFALFAILMVLANAFICGIGSLPLDRFQARVVWLVPLAALVLELRHGLLASILRRERTV